MISVKNGRDSLMKCVFVLCVFFVTETLSADWPTWGGNSNHSFSTNEKLSTNLHLQWTRKEHTPAPAWPASQKKLRFDDAPHPIISGNIALLTSTVTDSLTAIDLKSGKTKWQVITNGPIRFAPTVAKGLVYVGSDDGYLYCLELATGKQVWRFQGGPDQRLVLGNDRLISMWPVRGAPTVKDGTVYFAAGIWPFMGVFIYAVDAQSGSVIWCNSATGSQYIKQQHQSPAFAGISPQGYLIVSGDRLLIPGGRSVPMVMEAKTGKQLYFNLAARQFDFSKDEGGYGILTTGSCFANGRGVYNLADGKGLTSTHMHIAQGDTFIGLGSRDSSIAAISSTPEVVKSKNRKGQMVNKVTTRELWEKKIETPMSKLFIKADNHVVAASKDNKLILIDLDSSKVVWSHDCKSQPLEAAVSNGNLLVALASGDILCFGAKPLDNPVVYTINKSSTLPKTSLSYTLHIQPDTLHIQPDDLQLVDDHVTKSGDDVIIIESDLQKCITLRSSYYNSSLASRIHVIHGDLKRFQLPKYFATKIVVGNRFTNKDAILNIIDALHPYQGTAQLPKSASSWITPVLTENETEKASGSNVLVSRRNGLKGKGRWTHQNRDSANSMNSSDTLVHLPLGLLWYGGPSNDDVLPRHAHGPTPQVLNGQLYMEGGHMIRAVDVYTGRLLWQKTIKDLGKYSDRTDHHPGAGEVGGNFVIADDALYAMTPLFCLKLDPKTGSELARFTLPNNAKWGTILVNGDHLVATGQPLHIPFSKVKKKKKKKKKGRVENLGIVTENADYSSASRILFVLDRQSGEVVWKKQAKYGFRHNAVIAAAGKIFCLDVMSEVKLAFLKRRGKLPSGTPTLYAWDLATGRELWKDTKNAFGTWLSYSAEHKLLFQGYSYNRDRAGDEVKLGTMAVFDGAKGTLVWRKQAEYSGPCMLWHDKIIAQEGMYDLLTGNRTSVKNPITGTDLSWGFERNYGCNSAICSEHLITFRSAAAGYFDMKGFGGTGNFGGFKSGCTSNLIAADGVLNAPDYTRTCTCSYQLQTSLALVPMSDVETWEFTPGSIKSQVKRLGLNLGAHGDRSDADGTLWIDWPSVGGSSPSVTASVAPKSATRIIKHTSKIKGNNPLKWVASSGLQGVKTLSLDAKGNGTYRLRLVFPQQKGKTVSVSSNGKQLLPSFSLDGTASDAVVIAVVDDVSVNGKLTLSFSGSTDVIVSGVELVAK